MQSSPNKTLRHYEIIIDKDMINNFLRRNVTKCKIKPTKIYLLAHALVRKVKIS